MVDAASGGENNSGESGGYQLNPRMALSLIGPGLILLAGAFLFDWFTGRLSIPKPSTNELMKRALRSDADDLALVQRFVRLLKRIGVRALRQAE